MTRPVHTEVVGPCLFPPSGNLHPECAKMHEQGYCVCTMVQCLWCEHHHPPHRECVVSLKNEAPR